MDGGSKGALGLLRERCKLNGLKIDQYDHYTGGYHLRPDSHWTYAFDERGQVTDARKRTVSNVSTGAAFLLGGWDAAYSYDDIGNRTTSRFGGDGQEYNPVGSEDVGYEVNALNQYTEIANPRAFFVTGSAPAASSVGITLNGTAANRAVPHFWARQEVAGTGPTWADATLVATSGSSTVTVPKHAYVPPAVETPVYDADGNLVSDGRWLYAWDGENRLKEMTTQAAAVSGGVPELRLTYAYDGQSRRIRKLVEEKVSGSWVTRTDTRIVYDGWNLMAEVEYLGTASDAPPGTSAAPRPFLRRTYLWGRDLSGSLQGAGGVGGLLAITRHEHGAVPYKDYWVTSDLNGTVIGLITENGLRALYEYDPFGKPLRVSEPEEDLNPFRFSTKYTDAETGLYYYGYRYYDAVRGRWISRDPIGELGGINLNRMVDNDCVNQWDLLGTSIGSAAAARTIAKFKKSPLARTTGIVKAAEKLEALTGYEESTASLEETVGGFYYRLTRKITYANGATDDLILHELVHVYNHQYTGIGGLWAESKFDDEGMAYHLQNIYAAATDLVDFETAIALYIKKGDRVRLKSTSNIKWKQFWETHGVTANYPFKKTIGELKGFIFVDIKFPDELNLKKHLGAGLRCRQMTRLLNERVDGFGFCFSCDKEGPDVDSKGCEVIYTGVKLPFYQLQAELNWEG